MPDPAKRGLFRIQMGFITQHSVRMMFEPYGPFEVAEDHYRTEGYEPDFDVLPWQHENQDSSPTSLAGDRELAESDPALPELAGLVEPIDHRPGWFEQSIARLAAARFRK